MVKNRYAKGEGSIYQRQADGMWCGAIRLPDLDGKRRRKVVVAKTEAQVKAKLKAVKRELLIHGTVTTSGITLSAWLDMWFREIATKKIRKKTADTYKTVIEQYIKPSIGKTRIDKLTPAHVRKMQDYVTVEKQLSSTTAMQAHRVLAVALKYAEREGHVVKNVATLTDAPVRAHKELVVLSADNGIKVLQTVADEPLGSRWAAALFTGARQGELLGLTIDRVTDVLDLSWQLQRFVWEHGCGGTCGRARGTDCPERKVTLPASSESHRLEGGLWLSRPKSKTSWRILHLVEPLRTIIDRRIQVANTLPNPHNLVWSNPDGTPIDPSKDNAAWHDVLARAGVPDARLHDARHTTASLLLAAGVPEAIIMRILGHNSYAVTRGYQNVDRAQLEKAMKGLSTLLGG